MNSMRPLLLSVALALLGTIPLSAQTAVPSGGRVVLVLPFDNRTGDPTLNWVGESFPETLNKRLDSAGFLTISHDDRAFAYDHLGLPTEFQPSRATAIRIAQQLDANFVVIGSYSLAPSTATTASTANRRLAVEARALSLDSLTLSAPVQDSAELNRLFDVENAIAWKSARLLDPHFSVAEATFLAAPGAVPLPAFEDYIRGTDAAAPAERLERLRNAVALVPTYSAALLALGKEQYAQRDYAAAAMTLARVPTSDRLALEASFYLGLARFNTASYAAAADAFDFVANRLPLPEVVNNQGVARSRQGKDGTAFYQRAIAADPSDEDYHYNLAVTLFRRGDTAFALTECDAALKLKPADSEALALRRQLASAAPGTKLAAIVDPAFTPVERIRRNYSETGFRQATFQLDQLRSARLATLPAAERAAQYTQLGRDYLAQGLLAEAEAQFQSALAANPSAADAHAGLAQIRDASGDATQARNQANLSNQLKPNAAAWMVLARLDLAARDFPACANDVAHAQQLEPSNTAAAAMRAALQQHGQAVPAP